jgi:hypothetical protein
LDLVARLKEVAKVAGDLQKSLKKAKVDDISDQIEIQKYWKAMTLPRVDLSLMTLKVFSGQIVNLKFQILNKLLRFISQFIIIKHKITVLNF